MKRSSLTVALSLLLVFGSGIVVGIVGYRYYQSTTVRANSDRPRTPDDYRKAYLDEMGKRLALTPVQKEDLNQILDDTRTKFREVRERHRPEMKAIQDEQVAKINAMLTSPQQAEYAKMRAEREAKRQADEKGREPKPAPSSK